MEDARAVGLRQEGGCFRLCNTKHPLITQQVDVDDMAGRVHYGSVGMSVGERLGACNNLANPTGYWIVMSPTLKSLHD